MSKAVLLCIGLWLVGLLGLGWYVQQPEQFKILSIQAAADVPSLGHPVYAQFV